MGDVLTIIAEPPPGFEGDDGDGNVFIEDVVKAVPDHHRASSVADIAIILDQRVDPVRILQIVGHGSAGMLALGYQWTKTYSEGPAGPVYVLDSDPHSYGMLADLVTAPTEVWFLGCVVATGASGSAVASGRVLLYDFADMWSTTVKAPTGLIDGTQFARGVFAGSLVDHTGAVTNGAVGPIVPTPVESPGVTVSAVTSIPVLGSLRPRLARREADSLVSIANRYTRAVALPSLAAIDEVVFAATHQSRPCTASFVVGGRFLRVRQDGRSALFEAPDDRSRDDLGRTLRAVRRAAMLPAKSAVD
jgi:hypothetical protein